MKQILISILFLFSVTVFGATPKMTTWPYGDMTSIPRVESPDFKTLLSHIKTVKIQKRSMAGLADESDLSPEFRTFRDEFLACTTPDQLQTFLNKYDNKEFFETLPKDTKYFAAQVVMLKPFRSILYRLRTLFDKNPPLRSLSVTELRSIAGTMGIYIPDEKQWKAAFDYVSAPAANPQSNVLNKSCPAVNTNTQFTSISNIQSFLACEVAPAMDLAISRLVPIYDNPGDHAIIWDYKMALGKGDFKYSLDGKSEDNPERFHLHTQTEIALSIAGLYWAKHKAEIFCAYDQNALFNLLEKRGRQIAMDGFLSGSDVGISSEERTRLFSEQPASFLTLYSQNNMGRIYMNVAFKDLKDAVKYYKASWEVVKETDKKNNVGSDVRRNFDTVINPILMLNRFDKTEKEIKEIDAMLSGPTVLSSTITGELVTVNLPAFFGTNPKTLEMDAATTPPQNLKDLLPQKPFEAGESKIYVTPKLWYRNYYKGRAINWKTSAWTPYVSVNKGNMGDALRILRSSWGGNLMAGPIALVVQ